MWIGIEWALISLSLALWEIDLNMWNYLDWEDLPQIDQYCPGDI